MKEVQSFKMFFINWSFLYHVLLKKNNHDVSGYWLHKTNHLKFLADDNGDLEAHFLTS